MCSPELCRILSEYIDELAYILTSKVGPDSQKLDRLYAAACNLIIDEQNDCLGSDQTLVKLQELFDLIKKSLYTFCEHEAWEELEQLAIQLHLVKDQLETELDGVMV